MHSSYVGVILVLVEANEFACVCALGVNGAHDFAFRGKVGVAFYGASLLFVKLW